MTHSCPVTHTCVYPHKGFGGNSLALNHPLSLEDFDKSNIKVGSLVIPSGHEARLYNKPRYGKLRRVLRGPKTLSDVSNTGTKSLLILRHVTPTDEPTDFAANVYFPDHHGVLEGLSFDSPLSVDNVTNVGIPNDSIIQVKVGKNVILTLYEDINQGGNKIVLPGPFSGNVGALTGKISSFTLETKEHVSRVSLLETSSAFSNWALWLLVILIILLLLYLFYHYYHNRSVTQSAVQSMVMSTAGPLLESAF